MVMYIWTVFPKLLKTQIISLKANDSFDILEMYVLLHDVDTNIANKEQINMK